MLEIGWSELLLLAVVAIVVVGPKELPAMMRAFGKTVGGLKRTANQFRAQFDEAVRQSELDSLRAEVESVRRLDPGTSIRKAIEGPPASSESEPMTGAELQPKSAHEPVVTSRAALSQREASKPETPAWTGENRDGQNSEPPDDPKAAR